MIALETQERSGIRTRRQFLQVSLAVAGLGLAGGCGRVPAQAPPGLMKAAPADSTPTDATSRLERSFIVS